jgi:S-formylglutathione hydrolase
MKFQIFLPEDDIRLQRRKPYPALYFLAGLTCNHENVPTKVNFAEHAKRHNIAMIFPDTSPRDVALEASDDWTVGYGAGHYCNATNEPWKKHFKMYDYIMKELPLLVERYFHVDPEAKSITGFSMGGGGALMMAARNPTAFRSVSAFAPIGNPINSEGFAKKAFSKYFASEDDAKLYDTTEILNAAGRDLKLPPTMIDIGTSDVWMDSLCPEALERALGQNGHDIPIRWQEGYGHSLYFVTSFIRDHIDFHAGKLN